MITYEQIVKMSMHDYHVFDAKRRTALLELIAHDGDWDVEQDFACNAWRLKIEGPDEFVQRVLTVIMPIAMS